MSMIRASWWALDYLRYWLTPGWIRRRLKDRGY
jgi:hypothetical protein